MIRCASEVIIVNYQCHANSVSSHKNILCNCLSPNTGLCPINYSGVSTGEYSIVYNIKIVVHMYIS